MFGARGQGGLVPEQLSERLVTFYTRVLRPQDRAWFFRLICSEMGLNGGGGCETLGWVWTGGQRQRLGCPLCTLRSQNRAGSSASFATSAAKWGSIGWWAAERVS